MYIHVSRIIFTIRFHPSIHPSIYSPMTIFFLKWGETTREEMVLGAKRLGYGGETTKVEKKGEMTRGETTRGEMSWGRNVLLPIHICIMSLEQTYKPRYGPRTRSI